jgi:hypothetical protein
MQRVAFVFCAICYTHYKGWNSLYLENFPIFITSKATAHTMHSTKLARTIGAFATDELKAVRKAILQKARHRDSPVVKLWDALVPHHPEFDDEQLDLKYLFRKAYWGEEYEPQKLRNLMTTLQQYVEQYLIDTELQLQPQTQHLLLIQALHKRRRTGGERSGWATETTGAPGFIARTVFF